MKGGAWDERKGLDCRPAQDWPTPERCRPAWAPAHDGVAGIKTEKSGFTIEVTIPLLPPLVEAIEAGPTADLAFICGAAGTPLTKESFGNDFREACNKAGVRKSAHGPEDRREQGGAQRRDCGPAKSSAGRVARWRRCTRSPPIGCSLHAR